MKETDLKKNQTLKTIDQLKKENEEIQRKIELIQKNNEEIKKFVGGNTKNTPWNDNGGGNLIYLDRHNVDCRKNGIKRFGLVNDGRAKNYSYGYVCAEKGDLGKKSFVQGTRPDSDGGGNIIYLDRHNVDCGKDNVISQFNMGRMGNQIKYNYTCKKSNKPLTCRNVTTPANDAGGGNARYLDRHNVECADDEAMSRFKLEHPGGGKIQYSYTCCKY